MKSWALMSDHYNRISCPFITTYFIASTTPGVGAMQGASSEMFSATGGDKGNQNDSLSGNKEEEAKQPFLPFAFPVSPSLCTVCFFTLTQ